MKVPETWQRESLAGYKAQEPASKCLKNYSLRTLICAVTTKNGVASAKVLRKANAPSMSSTGLRWNQGGGTAAASYKILPVEEIQNSSVAGGSRTNTNWYT